MDIEPNPKFFTAPADTARAMHGSEMRGQDMQDAPERIWIAGGHYWPDPTFNNDKRSYTRTDLCITEAECQRRIDAAVLAERQVRTGAEMTDTQALRDLLVKAESDISAVDHVAIAILTARFYACEPEMYDGIDAFVAYITAPDQDWMDDARIEAKYAIRALIAQAEQ